MKCECECEIIRNETKMKYQSWKWRELIKNGMKYHLKNKNRNEWNDINWLLFIEWIKMIVVCDAHWKFHCVYQDNWDVFKKNEKKQSRMNRHSTHT